MEQDINLTVSIDSVAIPENTLKTLYFKEQINISARSFAKVDNTYLKGSVITWISDNYMKNLTEGPDTFFNLTIAIGGENFSAGINYVYLRFQQVNYTTTTFSFQLFIRAQNINLSLYMNSQSVEENTPISRNYNEDLLLSTRAYASAESKYLSGGSMTFINDLYEVNLTEGSPSWYNTSITISTISFSLGLNYVYFKFQLNNYTTTTFSFQILVNQININFETIDFEDSIEVFAGETIKIEIKLTESLSGKPIEGADISYDWEFGVGEFEEKDGGVYEAELEIPESIEGNYKLELIISKSGSVYRSTEEDLTITVKERELPDYWTWIIITALSIGIGLLAAISLRAYVFQPRARKKESELLAKTQNFKDMRNIQAVVIIHRQTGLPLYYKTYSFLEKADGFLFAGFVQAITTIGKEIAEAESGAEKQRTDAEHMMEIDFNYFYALIYDYEELRIVIILGEKSSEALREKLKDLAIRIWEVLSDSLKDFKGELKPFEEAVPSIIYNSIDLHYKEFFKLSDDKTLLLKTKKDQDFTIMETRLFNVLTTHSIQNSIKKVENDFSLVSIFKMTSEKNEDLVIEAIESLIKRKLIIPSEGNSGLKFSKRNNYK